MIRKAQAKDRFAIAELCYMIWEDMELDIVKNIEKNRLLQVLADAVTEVHSRSYKDHVWVYDVDGEVGGILIAYPGKHEMAYEAAWEQLDLDEDIVAFGSPLPVKEARDDEYYIETIASFPEYRGRGIATQLIQHVVASDTDAKWSLNCDYDNERAYRLYERLGFETAETIELYGHQYRHMIYRHQQ